MRIGNQYTPRGGEIRTDRSEATAPNQKPSGPVTGPGVSRVKSDIEVLREEMAGLKENRSEMVSAVKDRVARGDYQTRASAEKVAEAIAETFGRN